MKLLYLGDLNDAASSGCAVSGCDHDNHSQMFFHGNCHLYGGLEISFTIGSNHILIACQECKKEIVRVAIREK